MFKKETRTTRLTSPEPTGAAKWLQDMWDKARNAQVKTYMEYDTKMAVLNFSATLKRAIDVLHASPSDKACVMECYGSYDRTDRFMEDGETDNAEAEKFIAGFIKRLANDETLLLNKYASDRNIVLAAQGRRDTGCIVFTDGRREPIDPTTGFRIDGDGVKSIKMIETIYVILVRQPKK
jgi:hypothetical protein